MERVFGVTVWQHILQLFSKASQWVSLINLDDLLAPSGSELCKLIQAMYKPGNQPPLEILMKDLAIWLGKYVGYHTFVQSAWKGTPSMPQPRQHTVTHPNLGSVYMRQPRWRTVLSTKDAAGSIETTQQRVVNACTDKPAISDNWP